MFVSQKGYRPTFTTKCIMCQTSISQLPGTPPLSRQMQWPHAKRWWCRATRGFLQLCLAFVVIEALTTCFRLQRVSLAWAISAIGTIAHAISEGVDLKVLKRNEVSLSKSLSHLNSETLATLS